MKKTFLNQQQKSLFSKGILYLIFLIASQSILAQTAQSPAIELTDSDRTFIELRAAAKKNDVARSQQLAASLKNYPHQDYVTYYRIKPKLFNAAGEALADSAADAEVKDFIVKYQGTALADRMRNDWLLVLGKRKDWIQFDVHYPQFALNDDTQLKCYALQSQLEQGQNPTKLAIDSREFLLNPRYYGQACAELVASLVEAGGMTAAEGAAVARSASEMGLDTTAKQMRVKDPISEVVKSARANPAKAYKSFTANASQYTEDEQAVAWGVIGQFLAKKLDPNADDAFRMQQGLGFNELLSTESQEWKVRAGLRAKDWKLVKDAIEGMNSAVRRKDPAWTYWYGRALEMDGQKDKARMRYEFIADQYSFYGQLAKEELGASNRPPSRTKVT
uniref:hypothetical protein n=1 Tax=Polynucleobacter sp. TaxID=2029855 RepID=UPI004047B104